MATGFGASQAARVLSVVLIALILPFGACSSDRAGVENATPAPTGQPSATPDAIGELVADTCKKGQGYTDAQIPEFLAKQTRQAEDLGLTEYEFGKQIGMTCTGLGRRIVALASVTPSPTADPTKCQLKATPASAGSTTDVAAIRTCVSDLSAADRGSLLATIATNPNTPGDLLPVILEAARFPSEQCAVAKHPNVTADLLATLLPGATECVVESPNAPDTLLCDVATDTANEMHVRARLKLQERNEGKWREPCGLPPAFGGGMKVLGSDIQPGTYRAAGGDSCYWARLSGFSGTLTEIIANHFGPGPQVVTIYSSDAGFESERCGTWEMVE